MMTYDECKTALLNMAEDRPGSLACYGCGHEHNCATEGCAILRDALAQMEQLHRDVTGHCDCCIHGDAPCDQPPCDECFDARRGYQTVNWHWRGVVEAKQ